MRTSAEKSQQLYDSPINDDFYRALESARRRQGLVWFALTREANEPCLIMSSTCQGWDVHNPHSFDNKTKGLRQLQTYEGDIRTSHLRDYLTFAASRPSSSFLKIALRYKELNLPGVSDRGPLVSIALAWTITSAKRLYLVPPHQSGSVVIRHTDQRCQYIQRETKSWTTHLPHRPILYRHGKRLRTVGERAQPLA